MIHPIHYPPGRQSICFITYGLLLVPFMFKMVSLSVAIGSQACNFDLLIKININMKSIKPAMPSVIKCLYEHLRIKSFIALPLLMLNSFAVFSQTSIEKEETPAVLAIKYLPEVWGYSGRWKPQAGNTISNNINKLNTPVCVSPDSMLGINEVKAQEIADSYFRGAFNADFTYDSRKSGRGLIMASTLAGTPVLGILPFLVCSSKHFERRRCLPPENMPGRNQAFIIAYKSEAARIRKRNDWCCYVATSVIWICIAAFMVH